MKRPVWRVVRKGHEREDTEHNIRTAIAVLDDPIADHIAIALDVIGCRIVARENEPWPLNDPRLPLVPRWCVTPKQIEASIRENMAELLGGPGRHRPAAC